MDTIYILLAIAALLLGYQLFIRRDPDEELEKRGRPRKRR